MKDLVVDWKSIDKWKVDEVDEAMIPKDVRAFNLATEKEVVDRKFAREMAQVVDANLFDSGFKAVMKQLEALPTLKNDDFITWEMPTEVIPNDWEAFIRSI